MFLLKRTNDKSPFARSHIFLVLEAMLHEKYLDIHLVL
jgi:beta-galactosidase beta subunit